MKIKSRLKFVLLPALVFLLAMMAVPGPVLADAPPGMPHSFGGTVKIGEANAPIGTVISAQYDGVEYASFTTVEEGKYGDPAAHDYPLQVTGLTDGDIIQFFVNDIDTTQTFAFESGASTALNLVAPIVDTTPPTVIITELTPDPTNDNSPTFTGTATDTESNISSVDYKVDDGEWTVADAVDGTFDSVSEDYTFTTAELLDESHTVYVRATDAATNTTAEADYASDTFTVDTVAPTATVSPEADATDMPIDVVVSATFDEDIQAGDNFAGIAISGATGVDASIDGAILTIAHDAFDYETTYEVTIPAGAVNDLAGNPLAEAEVWSFTTGAEGPVSFTTSLSEGWNLLSTPILLDTDSDSMGQIFDTESLSNIEIYYSWDAVSEQWAQVLTDYELLPLYAIYVKVSSGASATAEFIPSGELSGLPSRELQSGLNLIGPAPALEAGVFPDKPLDLALASIAEAEGNLRGYTIVVSPEHNQPGWAYALGSEIEDLLPFKGYWVVMENADTLFGFSTTP